MDDRISIVAPDLKSPLAIAFVSTVCSAAILLDVRVQSHFAPCGQEQKSFWAKASD